MGDNSEKLDQFKAVTGTNDERARFYLDSATWNLEMALASFYDGDADETSADIESIEGAESHPPSLDMPRFKAPTKKTNPKFATIHSLNNASSEDEEEEGQAFYAGGSEHSGQQVLGPKKKDIVHEMFKSVKEHGIELLESKAGGSRSQTFRGTGYTLGQTNEDTQAVPGVAAPQRPRQVSLKLWRDGFTLDDGELRLYSDPDNQEFLSSVKRGEIPHELRQDYGEVVHVSMEDHRMTAYAPPANMHDCRSRHVFQGQGHTLGSPTPPTIGAPCADDDKVNEKHAKENLKVDDKQPTTNIQIRLADGTRLIGMFNHQHTIQQVRNYIISARPQYEARTFSLMTAYPPKVLDDDQTLAEAGLLNAAIIQKLT